MNAPWRRILDVLLLVVTLFRVVVAYTVDVAMTFRYPLGVDASACTSALCRLNVHVRAALHLDLRAYVDSGVDPVSAALAMPIRIMTGFYLTCFAPFLVVMMYALWTRKEWIRTPAIAMGVLIAYLMGSLILQCAWGDPPSTSMARFLAYNAIDVAAPVLILLRVLPRPLFVR